MEMENGLGEGADISKRFSVVVGTAGLMMMFLHSKSAVYCSDVLLSLIVV